MLKKLGEGIKRNVVVLSVVSLLNDISSEIIMPILPLFLSTVLGASAFIIGLIEGIGQSLAYIFLFISGWLSDRFGKRKIFVTLGYGFSTASKILFPLSTFWGTVLAGKAGDRIGKGIRDAPRDAVLAEITEKKVRGKVFGFHRAMDTLGAVIGPVLVILLLPSLGYRNMFWLALIPAVLGFMVLIVFFNYREKIKEHELKPIKINWADFDLRYKYFLLISLIFSLANFSFAFMILRSQQIGLATQLILIFYIIFNISYAIFSMPAGVLSDRIGRKKVLVIGFLIFSIVFFGFASAYKNWHIMLLFILYGLALSAFYTIQKAFVSDLVEAPKRATALGFYSAVTGIAALPAGLLAGVLWDKFTSAVPFYFSASISLLSALLMIILIKDVNYSKTAKNY